MKIDLFYSVCGGVGAWLALIGSLFSLEAIIKHHPVLWGEKIKACWTSCLISYPILVIFFYAAISWLTQ